MLFVGTGHDENILKEYIKSNDLEKEVIMCGKITNREELAKIYLRAVTKTTVVIHIINIK